MHHFFGSEEVYKLATHTLLSHFYDPSFDKPKVSVRDPLIDKHCFK